MTRKAATKGAKPFSYQNADEQSVLRIAEDILSKRLERLGAVTDPSSAGDFLRMRLAHLAHEEFHVLFLDQRHRILACEMLFRGGVSGAEVHLRVVAQRALQLNAAALILAHNHPSGDPSPSAADVSITARLREAMQLFDIRILDHLVVSASGVVSLAARGLL